MDGSTTYVHCGLPRTGTSSLQAVLADHRDRLARETGIDYPGGWRPGKSDAHHGLVELLESAASGTGAAAFDDLHDYLGSDPGRTVLVSSEALSLWLSEERRGGLIGLLGAMRAAAPVRCLWTLRSLDRWANSMYLHMLATGRPAPSPRDYFLGIGAAFEEFIAGAEEVGAALAGAVSYGRYEAAGGHHEEILRTVGVGGQLRDDILVALRERAPINTGLSQKGAIALLHTAAIEARAGVELPRPALRAALRVGELRFAEDAKCELVDAELRRAVHEAALRAARANRFAPYVELFGDHEVQATPAVSLEPAVLGEEDLRRLRFWAQPGSGGSWEPG